MLSVHSLMGSCDAPELLGLWDANSSCDMSLSGSMYLEGLEDQDEFLIRNDVILTESLSETLARQEGSYTSSLASDGYSVPSSPLSLDLQDDMESLCFPSTHSLLRSHHSLSVKVEPLSPTNLPSSPNSPLTTATSSTNTTTIITPSLNPPLTTTYKKDIKLEPGIQVKQEATPFTCKYSPQSLLKHTPSSFSSPSSSPSSLSPSSSSSSSTSSSTISRILCPRVSIKLENDSSVPRQITEGSGRQLPTSAAVGRQLSSATTTAGRQRLIQGHQAAVSAISGQFKGSPGGLIYLTEEEKRTLISEGYTVPTKLPLSKAEERTLKKIRRKIKNKISAQESRRKKKEYMDSLERKYQLLLVEANTWRTKAQSLEAENSSIAKRVRDLEERLDRVAEADERLASGGSKSPVMPPGRMRDTNCFPEMSNNCLDIDID